MTGDTGLRGQSAGFHGTSSTSVELEFFMRETYYPEAFQLLCRASNQIALSLRRAKIQNITSTEFFRSSVMGKLLSRIVLVTVSYFTFPGISRNFLVFRMGFFLAVATQASLAWIDLQDSRHEPKPAESCRQKLQPKAETGCSRKQAHSVECSKQKTTMKALYLAALILEMFQLSNAFFIVTHYTAKSTLYTTPSSKDQKEDSADIESLKEDRKQDTAYGTRETELGRMVQGMARTGMKDVGDLQVGDLVVARYEISSSSIWVGAGYEIIDMYDKGFNSETGQVEEIQVTSLVAENPKLGYTRYMKVYSPKYHKTPVVVTPDEIGLVTLRTEFSQAALLALPGLFWVFVASSFASNYNAKYGGNFFDAFFRT